ncbi:pimeloyl-ACP methyl ester carboxylesterase [Nonomuraea muscovyensis]|uniref:Pimeloyl-ACP methyl ester carboxylesterase n=1 Tax=Nonomuraea muscovyensis TaxID=1124761 RepID=A0A7X0C773_9ACTN|nr:alpha/beta fold hydrolase [Nonomuraea muscovyensis]MBB6349552.1 pimeloyl-ACP methyl ester carboxylesterase [Nonomuraea muscovyensis]
MDTLVAGEVTSADGTPIAFHRSGTGPPLVLVHGAFTGKDHPTLREVAVALSPWFSVYNYDRRGRGGSGDTPPHTAQREVEDLAALVALAASGGPASPSARGSSGGPVTLSGEPSGGPVMLFGGSSGAALALTAAARDPAVGKLALWEPPYHVGAGAPSLPAGFAATLEGLVRQGRRGDAVELFMVAAAEVPAEAVTAMRAEPSWPGLEALAHTLAYEAAVMGPGNALPTELLTSIRSPTLVLNGADSPRWMRDAGRAVAAAVPGAAHRVLDGQTHAVAARSLAPELLEFFVAG